MSTLFFIMHDLMFMRCSKKIYVNKSWNSRVLVIYELGKAGDRCPVYHLANTNTSNEKIMLDTDRPNSYIPLGVLIQT